MFSYSLVISSDFIVHSFKALMKDTALTDGAFAAIRNILDLAIAIHVFRAEVAAAEDVVHQALEGLVVQFMALHSLQCPNSVRSAEITDAEQGERLCKTP